LWDSPTPSASGPYAQHPVLSEVSRATRESLAFHLADGKPINAIKSLRNEFPELGLLEAKIFIETLAKFY